MFHKFSKGKAIAVGGDGTGWTIDSPFYWYRHTDNWKITGLNNSNSPESYNRRIYIRVKLNAGTNYQIGTSSDFDGKIWLYNTDGSEITSADDSSYDVNGEYFSDIIDYTPSTSGVYIIGAGAYSDGQGDIRVCCYPQPEQEEIPNSTMVYETSNGFNALGLPIRYRNADSAEIAFKTHPKKNLVLRYDFKSLTAETGQQFILQKGVAEFTKSDNVKCIFLNGETCLYTTDKTDQQKILSSGKMAGSMWFKAVADSPDGRVMFGRNSGGYELYSFNFYHGVLEACIGDWSQCSYNVNNLDCKWHHVVVTFDSDNSNKYSLYFDGKKVYTTDFNRYVEVDKLTIGAEYGMGSCFKGYLANIRLYDRALTEKEIQTLFKECKPKEELGKPAYFNYRQSLTLTENYNKFLPTGRIPRTVTAWINPFNWDNDTYWSPIITFGESNETNSFFCFTLYGNKLAFRFNGETDIVTDITVDKNQWSHIALGYDGNTTCYFYVNGELKGTYELPSPLQTSSAYYSTIGYGFDYYFKGLITDLNIYGKLLTNRDIAELYNKFPIQNGLMFNVPLASKVDNTSMFDRVPTYDYSAPTSGNVALPDVVDVPVNTDRFVNSAYFSGTPTKTLTTNNEKYLRTISFDMNVTGAGQYGGGILWHGSESENDSCLWFHIGNGSRTSLGLVGGYANRFFSKDIELDMSQKKWYHVLVTLAENGDYTLYIDNVSQGGGTSTFNTLIKDIFIGGFDPNGYRPSRSFAGNITNLNIYDRVLTTDEITTLYNGGEVTENRVVHIPLSFGKDNDSMFENRTFNYGGF